MVTLNSVSPKAALKMQERMLHPILFFIYMLFRMPLGAFAGLRCQHIDELVCEVSLASGWRTWNPFRSTYWAAQGMAAELATAVGPVSYARSLDVSMQTLVKSCSGQFHRQAKSRLHFRCEDLGILKEGIEKAVQTNEAVAVTSNVTGRDIHGEVVSTWQFEWHFKVRADR
jgi:hypothetical protein